MPSEPSANPPPATAYDEVAYPSYAHAQTHPDRLATAARLFGLEPAPVDRCRVLELGCGNGSNLCPMAAGLPGSQFVGIDLAPTPIAVGSEVVRSLGLNNIELRAADIMAIDRELGTFDYILAHGVYSWVPGPVRDRMLAVCRQHLAPHGVAFISYNAMPGGHLSLMLREMLLFHIRDLRAPQERITQSLALLQFLSGAATQKDGFHQWIKAETERALGYQRGQIFHDHLAAINEPIYFKDFVAHAGRHELQFLAEADFFELANFNFPDATRAVLRQLEGDRILHEQYLDFLKCRRFRQTLLCHRERALAPAALETPVQAMYISAIEPYKLAGFDPRSGVESTITTQNGGRMRTDFVPGKAALLVLGEAWPDRLNFPELQSRVRQRLDALGVTFDETSGDSTRLGAFLLELFRGGIISLHTWRPDFTPVVSARPAASPLARWQAATDQFVTSVFHNGVQIEDASGKHLMSLLDGTRDHDTLLREMYAFLDSLGALKKGEFDETELQRRVAEDLHKNLGKLARFGLLVA